MNIKQAKEEVLKRLLKMQETIEGCRAMGQNASYFEAKANKLFDTYVTLMEIDNEEEYDSISESQRRD